MYFLLRLWLGLVALALFLLLFTTTDEAAAYTSRNTSRITSTNTSRNTSRITSTNTSRNTSRITSTITSGNTPAANASTNTKSVDRGRYLIQIGGCNDCHTMGYGESGGKVPEQEWLVGGPMGFLGPWGTSYPINLRNMVDRMEQDDWVNQVKTAQALPPMPWFTLHAMATEDLEAMYAFIKHLGPKGEEAPAPLGPGVTPTTPYIEFVPKFPSGGTK